MHCVRNMDCASRPTGPLFLLHGVVDKQHATMAALPAGEDSWQLSQGKRSVLLSMDLLTSFAEDAIDSSTLVSFHIGHGGEVAGAEGLLLQMKSGGDVASA